MNIGVVVGTGRAAPYVAQDMGEALRSLGHTAVYIVMSKLIEGVNKAVAENPGRSVTDVFEGFMESIVEQTKINAAIGYGGSVMMIVDEGFNNFWEKHKIPYAAIWYDSPMDKNYFKIILNRKLEYFHQFIWDKIYVEQMKVLDIPRVFYLPIGVNQNKFKKLPDVEKVYDICFVGSFHPMRALMMNRVFDEFPNIVVRGYDWNETDNNDLDPSFCEKIDPRPCTHEEMNELFNKSKIVLNITMPQGLTSLNMRVLEGINSGSLMITDYKSEIDEFYNGAIQSYENLSDLCVKLHNFLEHKEAYEWAIAKQSQILPFCSYEKRAERILDLMD